MKRALVMDDTKSIRTMLKTCLELQDYETLTVNNGYEGLEILRTHTIDLVFLDIKMPEISGTEVLKKMRADGINVPVVIMTAFATVKNAIECTKLGAVTYLQKPFSVEKIKSVIEGFEKPKNSLNFFINSSKELIEDQKADEALLLLKKALSIYIDSSEIYHLIGKTYELKANSEEAQKFYDISEKFKL
jgi:two-component system, OmpR family, response regulator